MAFNWLKRAKTALADVARLQLERNDAVNKAKEWETQVYRANQKTAQAEHDARSGAAYKDEVLFLRALVKDLTATPRVIHIAKE